MGTHTIKTKYGAAKSSYGQYNNGRLAISYRLESGEPLGVLTVNIPHADIDDGEIIVKTWSENESLAKSAMGSGLFVDTGKRIPTGFVEAQVWKFCPDCAKEKGDE